MVEEVDGGRGRRGGEAWRGRLALAVLALTGIANACGGRTVWVEEEAEAGQAGDGGTNDGGTGAYGGTGYGGDYGGGGYGGTGYGGYGGDYGGTGYGGYGGDTGGYGGTGYSGYGGAYGGYGGGVAGTSYGGVAGIATGGVAGNTYGGSAGYPTGGVGGSGKGGCGPTGGASGAGGFPGLYKGCSVFCPRYPYMSCPADFDGPRDCLAQCQNGFGLPAQCQAPLYDFLVCAGQVLNPSAQCVVGADGQCYGPGCTVDAINACVDQYLVLLQCTQNPIPPCPPPPDRPPPPNCTRNGSYSGQSCQLVTSCPSAYYVTQCSYEVDDGNYLCDCMYNGQYTGTVAAPNNGNPCQAALDPCGFQ